MIRGLMKGHYTILLLLLLIMAVQPASAQLPTMSVLARWTPDEQLTSVAGDTRTVRLEVSVRGNVQFWAANMGCNIGFGSPLALTNLELAPAWEADLGRAITEPPLDDGGFNADGLFVGNRLALTISRVGFDQPPLGQNGVTYTLPLFTATFQVSDALTTQTTVAASCTTNKFLNRNGGTAVNGLQSSLPALVLRPGYQLSGRVTRQGVTNNTGINVACEHLETTTTYNASSNFLGDFTFSTVDGSFFGDPLREFGWYRCTYSDANNVLLNGESYINLRTPSYRFLPVQLYTGNADDAAPSADSVTLEDLVLLTGNFGTRVTAFTNGDVNGDSNVNDVDLALTAANVGRSGPTHMSNVLYGMATSVSTTVPQPNSKIYRGTPESGAVTPLSTFSSTRDFWPQASPDGSEVAYVAFNQFQNRYELKVASAATGFGANVTNFAFRDDSFAPSWSPDGGRIAFICAASYNASAGVIDNVYQENIGDICIHSRSDFSGNSLQRLGVQTELFPPAWVEYSDGQYGLIYSENDVLKFQDLATNAAPITIGAAPITGDRPVVINYYNNAGDIDNYLFYRDNAGDIQATFISNYDGTTMTLGSEVTVVDVTATSWTDATAVDYYDVSPLLDVMYYTFADQTLFTNLQLQFDDDNPLTPPVITDGWSVSGQHRVDGATGTPAVVGGNNTPGPWTPSDVNTETDYHAQRITFDWIP